jgi:hypothetical protein
MWPGVKRVLGINVPSSTLVETSQLWNNKKKNLELNMINNATILRIIWLTRNDMVFNQIPWVGMQVPWRRRVAYTLAQWIIVIKGEEKGKLMRYVSRLHLGSCSASAVLTGAWLTPEKRAKSELEVYIGNVKHGSLRILEDHWDSGNDIKG